MLRTKLTAGAMSAVLVATLCPGLAMAAQLGTGSIADDDSATLTTQKDKKVWVINKVNGAQTVTYTNHGLVKTANGYTLRYHGTKLAGAKVGKKGLIKYRLFYKGGKLNKGWLKVAGDKYKYTFTYDGNGRICKQVMTHTTKKWLGRTLQKARTLSTTTQDIARDAKGLPIQTREYTTSATGAEAKTTLTKLWFERNNIVKTQGNNEKASFFTNRYKKVGKEQRIRRTTVERWDWANGDWTMDTTHFDPITYSYKKIKVPEKFVKVVKAQQWALQNYNLNKAFGPVDAIAFNQPMLWEEGPIW